MSIIDPNYYATKSHSPYGTRLLKALFQQEMLFSIGKTMNTIIPTCK